MCLLWLRCGSFDLLLSCWGLVVGVVNFGLEVWLLRAVVVRFSYALLFGVLGDFAVSVCFCLECFDGCDFV